MNFMESYFLWASLMIFISILIEIRDCEKKQPRGLNE